MSRFFISDKAVEYKITFYYFETLIQIGNIVFIQIKSITIMYFYVALRQIIEKI